MRSRRTFLRTAGLASLLPSVAIGSASQGTHILKDAYADDSNLKITGIKIIVVKINQRGDWHFIELLTNKGLVGVGECSHAFPKIQADGNAILKAEALKLFELIHNRTPFEIEAFREAAMPLLTTKILRTVFSGIEQALWDLSGKSAGLAVHDLFGGKVRDKIRVYANINRATNERDSNGRRPVSSFQKNAEEAARREFTAVKLAPFDEMHPLATATPQQVEEDIDYAIGVIEGVRSVVGPHIDLLVDVHSHLNVELATSTAKRLEASSLFWFEEPVDPQKFPTETKDIRQKIMQVLAGGESIFGRQGYKELLQTEALGIIMPDVKHCGGLTECRLIAALAETFGEIKVAPHNPSGPVATAASVAVCSVIPNFAILEYAFGEVPWSGNLVSPAEEFSKGHLVVREAAGLGISLNYPEIKKHL